MEGEEMIMEKDGAGECRGEYKRQAEIFFYQAEDNIRDVERSRGLGDVYEGQEKHLYNLPPQAPSSVLAPRLTS